jgi:hypothetical protein
MELNGGVEQELGLVRDVRERLAGTVVVDDRHGPVRLRASY